MSSASSRFDFRVAGFARIQAIGNKTEVWRLRLQFITLIPNLDEEVVLRSDLMFGLAVLSCLASFRFNTG